MPTWQPDWTDVRFDHHAAAVAVEAAESVAASLRRAMAQRPHMVERAHHVWAGPSREDFDRSLARLLVEENGLEAALRALARAINQAATEATALQAQRVADRERWNQENAAEHAQNG